MRQAQQPDGSILNELFVSMHKHSVHSGRGDYYCGLILFLRNHVQALLA